MATSSRSARTEDAAMNSGSPVILNRWGAIHVRGQMLGRMRAPGNDVHALFVVIVGVRCCRLSGSERCAGLPECSSCSCTSMRLQTYAPPNFHWTSCSRRICTPLHSHTHPAADAAACPSAPTRPLPVGSPSCLRTSCFSSERTVCWHQLHTSRRGGGALLRRVCLGSPVSVSHVECDRLLVGMEDSREDEYDERNPRVE